MNGKGKITRRLVDAMLCFGLTVVLGGCRHKTQVATLPPVLTPVPLMDIPEPENLPMVEAQQIKLPPVPYASDAGKPKRVKKKAPPKAQPTRKAA